MLNTDNRQASRIGRLAVITGLVTTLLLAACGDTATPDTPTGAATTAAANTLAATTGAAPATTASTTTAAATTAASTTATTPTAAASGDTSPKVVAAAQVFLATLDSTQTAAVQFDFSNTAQKSRWSNLPEGGFSRAGLMWGNLTEPQRQAWLNIMSTTLSKQGYQRLLDAWNADQVLADTGGGLKFGTQYYWLALIGTPSMTTPWMWQFGGHHFTINATVVGSDITLTPSYIGVQPTTYTDATGKQVRPLGDIETISFALLNSLDATQKSKGVLGTSVIDVVLGPGQDGKTIPAQGLPASAMTAEQQNSLLSLIGYYTNILNDEDAANRMSEIKANLSQTYFAWYGPVTSPSAYFRVSGPTVVIEYAPQGAGGGGRPGTTITTAASQTASTVTHVHGIYRDPTNDYGVRFINK